MQPNSQYKINTSTLLLCCINIIRVHQQMFMCFSKQKTEWTRIDNGAINSAERSASWVQLQCYRLAPQGQIKTGVVVDRLNQTAIFQTEQHKTNSHWLLKLIRKKKLYWEKTNVCFCQKTKNILTRRLFIQPWGCGISCFMFVTVKLQLFNDISLLHFIIV